MCVCAPGQPCLHYLLQKNLFQKSVVGHQQCRQALSICQAPMTTSTLSLRGVLQVSSRMGAMLSERVRLTRHGPEHQLYVTVSAGYVLYKIRLWLASKFFKSQAARVADII